MSMEQQIRTEARRLLQENIVDLVIGFENGTVPFKATPVFVRDAANVDKLVWGPFCSNNLARFLIAHRDKKVGIVAKGCDARAVVQLVVEHQLERDKLYIIGVPCTGMLNVREIARAAPGEIASIAENGDELVVKGAGFKQKLPRAEYLHLSCQHCAHPNPPVYDVLIGEELPAPAPDDYADVKEMAARPAAERWAYYEREMARCIRCYACREACPMCYCTECFVDHATPRWISTGVLDSSAVQLWQLGRVYHQAGRCVECGACERACPMEIPLLYLLRKQNMDMRELYDFETGLSVETPLPLATFDPEVDVE